MRKRIESFKVVGPWVRTTNAAEAGGKGKIGGLWQRFFKEGGSPPVHAVYTNYEVDFTAAYDLIVGKKVDAASELGDRKLVTVEAGDYEVFVAEGPMPQALIATWGEIWKRWPAGNTERLYRTDFEVHEGGRVLVHVGVK